MSRGRNGAAGGAKGARRATVAAPAAVLVERADGRRANALPCNRPLEYGGSYLSKKSGIALQFTFLKEIPSTLIVANPMGIILVYLQVDEALGAIAR